MPFNVKPGVFVRERCEVPRDWEPLGPLLLKIGKRWEHDCDQCDYLGSLLIEEGHYDFYRCPASSIGPSYIARYGEEAEYVSYPAAVAPALGAGADDVHHILCMLCRIDQAEDKNSDFGFAVVLSADEPQRLTVLIDPLRDPRHIQYVRDAVIKASPEFQYNVMRPETFVRVVHRVSELVHEQIEMER